jgi:hypothetical protein
MQLRAKPPENQSNTRRFRIGPTPTLPSLQRNDRERLMRALDAAPVLSGSLWPASWAATPTVHGGRNLSGR